MDFVIIKPAKEHFEVEQLFTFYIGKHGDYRCMAGCYQGNINDREFALKLDRVRARMMMKSLPVHQSVCAITNKQVKQLNDFERYSRKMTKVFNEYWKQIDQCNGLFRETEIKKLSDKYKSTVAALKQRYNQCQ